MLFGSCMVLLIVDDVVFVVVVYSFVCFCLFYDSLFYQIITFSDVLFIT